jgi:hypothetical protein
VLQETRNLKKKKAENVVPGRVPGAGTDSVSSAGRHNDYWFKMQNILVTTWIVHFIIPGLLSTFPGLDHPFWVARNLRQMLKVTLQFSEEHVP